MSSYRLSSEAARQARQWDVARAGNVVPLRRAEPVREERVSQVPGNMTRDEFLHSLGMVDTLSATGVIVNAENAMTVPAFASGVNFIASTVASLPLDLYRKQRDGSRKSETGSMARLLHDAVNEALTSYEWRRGLFTAKLTAGRGYSYIERAPSGRVISLWPMDPACVMIKRRGFTKFYEYNDGNRPRIYEASEVIDLPFMLKNDGVSHRSPLAMGKDVLGLAIAITKYGARFFANGGIPPFAIEGNFQTPAGMQRAADDLAAATIKAADENRQALALPANHKIVPIGVEPEKAQMVETKRFCIEEIARLLSLPPTFLQDLTHGTYSNTEQQDLHFVKHTLLHHAEQFEQELNLKLFGSNSSLYVELNVDGLLRGDFKTRMEGWARAVNSGLVMPNEARKAENWPDAPGGNQLFMQSGTVPIGQAGQDTKPTATADADDDTTDDPEGAQE